MVKSHKIIQAFHRQREVLCQTATPATIPFWDLTKSLKTPTKASRGLSFLGAYYETVELIEMHFYVFARVPTEYGKGRWISVSVPNERNKEV